jgi:hypothetical protein
MLGRGTTTGKGVGSLGLLAFVGDLRCVGADGHAAAEGFIRVEVVGAVIFLDNVTLRRG